MALIKCPDCGKMFSEYADCCPECGCPTAKAKEVLPPEKESRTVTTNKVVPQKTTSKKRVWGLLTIVAILLIGIGTYFYVFRNGSSETGITDMNSLSEKESLEVIQSLAKNLGKYDGMECLNDFHNGLAKVERDNKFGYICISGKEVIPCIYDAIGNFSEGLAWIRKNELFGYINTKGEEVIPCQYPMLRGSFTTTVSDFSEGLARISKEGYDGFINNKGEEVIPCNLSWNFVCPLTGDFKDGLAKIYKGDGKYGYIDTNGKEVIPCQYSEANNFSEGLARVKYQLGLMYIDTTGDDVIFLDFGEYSEANDFHDGLALFKRREVMNYSEEKYGFINKKGEEVIPCQYSWFTASFSEGLALAYKGDKCGYINKEGQEVIPFIYENGEDNYGYEVPCGSFSCGLAVVCRDNKWGFIDKQGSEVIPLKYDGAGSFSEGLGMVRMGNKWGYIDKYGHCTLDY